MEEERRRQSKGVQSKLTINRLEKTVKRVWIRKERSVHLKVMEEITHLLSATTYGGATKRKKKKQQLHQYDEKKKHLHLSDDFLINLVIKEYKDPASPAFGRNATTVRSILVKKFPQHRPQLTPAFVRSILENHSPAYSTTRTTIQTKSFHGTSFYSLHPHCHWHVDLQDMTIFKRAGKTSRKGTPFNFMLICVDDFSNFFMV